MWLPIEAAGGVCGRSHRAVPVRPLLLSAMRLFHVEHRAAWLVLAGSHPRGVADGEDLCPTYLHVGSRA